MRIAIISDLHLGDPMSVMAVQKDGQIRLGAIYKEFKAKIAEKVGRQPLDYLVLLGDILDFSIASYNEAYAIGKHFFQQLKDDNIANEIIYMPGNHDSDLWHTVEYQTNVTRKLEKGDLPIPFRMSVPGIIDERTIGENIIKGFTLLKVTPRTEQGLPRYAGLFLDKITKPDTYFNFVYPNLYLVTDDDTILITHGQYLEIYWSLLGKWVFKIINGDLQLEDSSGLDLKETVGINFPLNQLASSGVGQAGPLTKIIRNVEHDVKNQNLDQLKIYFNRLWRELKKVTGGVIAWFVLRCPPVKWVIKNIIFDSMGKMGSSRYDKEFLKHPEVRERFVEFYKSTKAEIDEINGVYHTNITAPTRMIFGHTHEPIPWESPDAPSIELEQLPKEKQPFKMYNSGGWLNTKNEKGEFEFCGAEIFFYETGKGISSVSIVSPPENKT